MGAWLYTRKEGRNRVTPQHVRRRSGAGHSPALNCQSCLPRDDLFPPIVDLLAFSPSSLHLTFTLPRLLLTLLLRPDSVYVVPSFTINFTQPYRRVRQLLGQLVSTPNELHASPQPGHKVRQFTSLCERACRRAFSADMEQRG